MLRRRYSRSIAAVMMMRRVFGARLELRFAMVRLRDFTDESNHHAIHFWSAFGTDHRIRLVLGLEHEPPAMDIQSLERELIIDYGDDDIAALGARRFLLDD